MSLKACFQAGASGLSRNPPHRVRGRAAKAAQKGNVTPHVVSCAGAYGQADDAVVSRGFRRGRGHEAKAAFARHGSEAGVYQWGCRPGTPAGTGRSGLSKAVLPAMGIPLSCASSEPRNRALRHPLGCVRFGTGVSRYNPRFAVRAQAPVDDGEAPAVRPAP
jgi:hypothetical protein